jgi:hypothetical protein
MGGRVVQVRPAATAGLALMMLGFGAVGWAASAQQPEPVDDPAAYPDHPGREETVGFCTACHGFSIVAAQGMTREQWDGSLNWMTERHNMPDVEGDERRLLLDYLEKAFPPKAPATARGAWKSPFTPP